MQFLGFQVKTFNTVEGAFASGKQMCRDIDRLNPEHVLTAHVAYTYYRPQFDWTWFVQVSCHLSWDCLISHQSAAKDNERRNRAKRLLKLESDFRRKKKFAKLTFHCTRWGQTDKDRSWGQMPPAKVNGESVHGRWEGGCLTTAQLKEKEMNVPCC